VEVTLLYFDDCPNWRVTDAHLRALADEFPGLTVRRQPVDSDDARFGFRGSPTVLLDGVDPFDDGDASAAGMACRVFATPSGLAGSPTLHQLRNAVLRAGGVE
jgi:hypothetical protein